MTRDLSVPDPAPIPATRVNPAYWAALEGMLARTCRVSGEANPYASARPALALCWAWGRRGCPKRETVSRETIPARGDEWPPEAIEVLRLARGGGQGVLSDQDLAAITGKSHQAVSNQLHRLRRQVAAPIGEPTPC